MNLSIASSPGTPRSVTVLPPGSAVRSPAVPPCRVPVEVLSPEAAPPDLECSVCFSQFNNVFRCPKMLLCKHTFCLECLTRINVKSSEPCAVRCPMCRHLTALPPLGPPKLTTDPRVLSLLPAAMQRVYSVRFHRSKGKLQVKRCFEGQWRWGRRSSATRSVDVGLPSPRGGGGGGEEAGALCWLTWRPACRAFLLTTVVVMMVLLSAVVVFLLVFHVDQN